MSILPNASKLTFLIPVNKHVSHYLQTKTYWLFGKGLLIYEPEAVTMVTRTFFYTGKYLRILGNLHLTLLQTKNWWLFVSRPQFCFGFLSKNINIHISCKRDPYKIDTCLIVYKKAKERHDFQNIIIINNHAIMFVKVQHSQQDIRISNFKITLYIILTTDQVVNTGRQRNLVALQNVLKQFCNTIYIWILRKQFWKLIIYGPWVGRIYRANIYRALL